MSDGFVIVYSRIPRRSSVDDLPRYAAEGAHANTLDDRIAATPGLALPILATANIRRASGGPPSEAALLLAHDICAAFHTAVTNNQDDVITRFVMRGYVSPDTPDAQGETPLLAAARRGHVAAVRALIALGASVDGFGLLTTFAYERGEGSSVTRRRRTPLQAAAEAGHLAVVKVLMEEGGADDGLVSPDDGALALRLAAAGGHREVVAYLPARRGGGWRRWRARHTREARAVRRAVRRIGRFLYYALVAPPKLLVWHLPRWMWEERARIVGWLGRKVAEVPKVLRKAPQCVSRAAKAVPELCGRAARAIGRTARRTPGVLALISRWVLDGIARTYRAVGYGMQKLASLAHTAVAAALSWFKRITLRDVWRGLVIAVRAVVFDVPKAVVGVLADAGEVIYKSLKMLFGCLGACVYYGAVWAGWVAVYVPKRLAEVAMALGRSVANTMEEVMVHIDPKRI
ncbi:Ankyrin repeat-containing domain protein [Cordyceps fumosorosea ARSEF 2679]|uniref:Ankyrin repeat-containing domain protein n=1 Tax=Cordyceps fumosorosea (strain ARSEF 2679) TaxID=1081104 RepID=A0A162MUB5_CORFA|nr:Ankyrin repeat-containing domain protein [Cordyceps fumosorosea ARSEF 2679]OAA70569.1 Ankyrin repeat-containing domain protein [Cordyceps fumosorosea ARSEF 2679]